MICAKKNGAICYKKCFAIGFLIGFLLSVLPSRLEHFCDQLPPEFDNEITSDFEPQLNLAQKPMTAKRPIKNIVRPRYFSTELGIREKLFVGVISTPDNIETFCTAFNRTAAHLVHKVKYFINANSVRNSVRLKNIVGFTDNRSNLRIFHVLKYIADNYVDQYDYFLLLPDTTYVNARRLVEQLGRISVSREAYMGERGGAERSVEERTFCDLDAGVVLSSGVIKKIRENLDWCVRNAAGEDHGRNLGECVKHATGIEECQRGLQGVEFEACRVNGFKIYRDLHLLKDEKRFNRAVTVYPLQDSNDFFLLHTYFSRVNLDKLTQQLKQNEEETRTLQDLTTADGYKKDILEIQWPQGVPQTKPPDTRYDIINWEHLNETHSFMGVEENVKILKEADREDFQKILNRTIAYALSTTSSLSYDRIHSAYRRFDAVRGMEYRLHLVFVDRNSKESITKSFEVMKPLGSVEIIPSPYVTESTRIVMLVPVLESDIKQTGEFLRNYEKLCMETQDNTFLMLVLMYRVNSSSKSDDDVFLSLKTMAIHLTDKYKTSGSRVAWLSIRLPGELSQPLNERDILLNSAYGRNDVLSLAMTDLALKKIGLDSLIMIIPGGFTFKADFLNRVRMNTIQGFQVFSPLGFTNYPCKVTMLCTADCAVDCDISQASGYFNRYNFDVVSFYSKDYVEARKALEASVPIVKKDHDIVALLHREDQEVTRVIDIFIKASQSRLHVLRAHEPNLHLGRTLQNYLMKLGDLPQCEAPQDAFKKCLHYGSKKQISEAIVQFEDEVINS